MDASSNQRRRRPAQRQIHGLEPLSIGVTHPETLKPEIGGDKPIEPFKPHLDPGTLAQSTAYPGGETSLAQVRLNQPKKETRENCEKRDSQSKPFTDG
jgi:hypothetical protein